MAYEYQKVDQLMEVVEMRMAEAAATVTTMRVALLHGEEVSFWRLSGQLADHLIIAGRSLSTAQTMMLNEKDQILAGAMMQLARAPEGGMAN